MALPTPQRTWIITACNRISYVSIQDVAQRYLYGIKEFLKANGYTVKGSSNTTTGAMDAVDRWVTPANVGTVVNGTTSPQSWIVLTDTSGTNLLLAYQGAANYYFKVAYSPGNLFVAAGTPTHQPTATDEVVVQAQVDAIDAQTGDRLWSGWVDAAGNGCRFAIARAGIWRGTQWGVEQISPLVEAPAVLPKTIWGFSMTPLQNPASVSLGSVIGVARVALGGGAGTNISINFGMEVFPIGATAAAWPSTWGAVQPELQGGSGFPIWPLTLQSSTTGFRGKLGNAADHWTCRTNGADGDTYGTLQFIAMGGYLSPGGVGVGPGSGIWPWDGVSGVVMT